MEIHQDNNRLYLSVDAAIYTEAVIFKCLYWYTNTFEVDICQEPATKFNITLTPKAASPEPEWNTIQAKLKQDLIDFKLRQLINNETQNIRELIIAKAFAYYEQETDAEDMNTAT
ncbi:MAG TPA: His-Xaa-Ser system protein HxsD [Chitinophaga sp.]|uniref:His-Xaa-Ser system protein HxsD n=1 Tax=Chitinophaga sp. TaxID=1869181 RepID=UPI002B92FF19|nr:His-Xaa-Ser system protein HxsD [Chitinophaga sp.]HVI48724.1 His-Xaa-Ser system protein HxsD [Chitinophaga sp.]